jgi:shikimate kinase
MDEENATNDYPMRNILLVGFMGCGKSTIGRVLHKSLDYPFIDTDQQIEKQTGKKISTIFEEEGEAAFRQQETQFLEKLIEKQTNHAIISTGGGIVTRPENFPLLRQLGFVIWLTCSPEVIHERTSRNNNRPLLQCDNPKEVIATMLAERDPLYEAASHLKINSSNLDINEVSCGILESARYHFGSGIVSKDDPCIKES